jgi:hypothetical protein
MSDFTISSSQTIDSNPEARAQLDASLAAFSNYAPVQGSVNGEPTYSDTPEVETEEVETEVETETEVENSGFELEFESKFGVKTNEAVEILNSLSAFRDEMTLMRQWSINPSEYDARMGQVKEFYSTLPADKQTEFNTLDGAKAIWEHLQKNNTQVKRQSTVSKVGGTKKTQASNTPVINKSEILKMDKATYASRLPEITKAWREGRVVEDI